MEDKLQSLKARLDECESWPCEYPFTFIVPATSAPEMAALLSGYPFTAKQSSGGKYLSYRVTITARSSEEVISIYRAALQAPGCMAL